MSGRKWVNNKKFREEIQISYWAGNKYNLKKRLPQEEVHPLFLKKEIIQ